MHGILAERALKRGIDHLPITPHQPHLNNVEGIVASFKADVACCLLKASTDGGPIGDAYVMACAEYVAYTRERFVPKRKIEALKECNRTRYECNTGVPPRPGMVPFGTPGWAYVPVGMRKRRGAPKYERAEKVLCVGYQHMYTTVYKLLTQHNTIIHSEQVVWDTEAPALYAPSTPSHTETHSPRAGRHASDGQSSSQDGSSQILQHQPGLV